VAACPRDSETATLIDFSASDARCNSAALGETVTINILTDLVNTYVEDDAFFQFTKFDGTRITIRRC
jgi:hypothetical protein